MNLTDGFELLDLYGPLEMFGSLGPERVRIVTVAQAPGPIASVQGPKTLAEHGFGGDEQLHPVIVEHVHQPREAAGGIGVARRDRRHVRQDHRMKAPGQIDVVGRQLGSAALDPRRHAGVVAIGVAGDVGEPVGDFEA
jgi:putative intracellular protease/amidase